MAVRKRPRIFPLAAGQAADPAGKGAGRLPHDAEARKVKGLRIAAEGFADRVYADDGQLVTRKLGKDALITDPARAAEQAVRMAMEGKVRTITGKVIDARVETICIHGDSPGSDKIVAAVREGLVKAGATVKPLRDWLPR